MLKSYVVESNKLSLTVSAENRREAFIKFFIYVFKNWSKVRDKIGILATLEEDGEQYGIRTIPTLLNLRLIDNRTALDTLRIALGDVSLNELYVWCLQDRWIAKEVLKNIG